ncbi:MAG: chemotaxis protein CheX [Pirellulaceae bacterium]
MRAEYINPFIKALVNTFDTMLGCEVTRGQLVLKENNVALHEISGTIGLSGKAVGTVVVSLSREVALQGASAMLMMEATEIDEDVIDAVGEITNMVAGSAKAELEEYQLSISLPNVITGKNHEIRFPSQVKPICVPFSTPWGELTLEVGLELVPEAVGA